MPLKKEAAGRNPRYVQKEKVAHPELVDVEEEASENRIFLEVWAVEYEALDVCG